MGKQLSDYVRFNDKKFERQYKGKKIPMSELVEAYLDERVDLVGDIEEFLRVKNEFVSYKLITKNHMQFIVTRMVPEVAIHSQKQDTRIVREHYDRGNDFFEAFLGDRMIYTSGFFKTGNESLEEAQDNKCKLVSHKMQLKANENLLDIGCGWGTLVRWAAKEHNVNATGVTIAKEQTEFANARIEKDGTQDKAKILCMDYRDIPTDTKYNKITCLEMAEHVGVRKFQKFMDQIYNMLEDDGLFYLQIAGLRRGVHFEDLVWGLFMSKYIFSGADASCPLSWVVDKLEKANFEVHSVENVGIHYSLTIKRWYDNWMEHRDEITGKYGERWFRLWEVFLAWSVQIAAQGSSTCFQIVCNKNLDQFDRTRFFQTPQLGEQDLFYYTSSEGKNAPSRKAPQPTLQ